MRLLVTGASGFVGINLVREIASREVNVFASTIGEPAQAAVEFLGEYGSLVQWIPLDVRNKGKLNDVFSQTEIDTVIHGAAVTSVSPDGSSTIEDLLSTNVMGTVNVIEAARACGCKRIVYLSSGAVYGNQDPILPISEDHALRGASPYAVSKIVAELLCRTYAGDLSVTICRLGTLYGPMEIANPHRTLLSIPCRLVELMLRKNTIRVFGLSRGRPYCYVGDAARAVADLALSPSFPSDTFNVCVPERVSLSDLLGIVSRIRPDVDFKVVDDREDSDLAMTSEDERPVLDTARLESVIPGCEWCKIEIGIMKYLDWLRASKMNSSRSIERSDG